ncbi:hypothetical protein Y032_0224g2729 [Ancylostoma ceylanicum]|nr:hypothetical protein Y032_0224g2729 [Ancylostoma ceylanicum]
MIAFGDVLHQLGQYVMVISHDIAPEHVIPQRICMHLQAAPLFGLCFSSIIVLCVAIDRILALHRIYLVIQSHQKLYLTTKTTTAVLFSISFIVWSYVLVDDRYVTCGIPDVFTNEAYDACFGAISVISVLLIICYAYVGYRLRNFVTRDDQMQGVVRSLLLISTTVVFGWFSTNLIRFGANFLQIRFEHRITLDLIAGVFVHISCATNFFIYYFVSVQQASSYETDGIRASFLQVSHCDVLTVLESLNTETKGTKQEKYCAVGYVNGCTTLS